MRTLPIVVLLVAGVANAEPVPKPTLTFGSPIKIEPADALDAATLQRALARNLDKLLDCYEKARRTSKELHGTVTAQFTIDGNGAVTTSTASGLKHPRVEACIADVIKHISFAKPKGGGNVAVSYPMLLEPESKIAFVDDHRRQVLDNIIDRDTRLAKFSGGIGAGPGAGPVSPGPGGAGPGTAPRDPRPGDAGPRAVQIAFQAPTGDFGNLTAEEIDRVIRARAGIFRACYQKELNATPGLGGKVVAHFTIGGDGAIAAAATAIASDSTLRNEAIELCLRSNINRLKFPAKGSVATINYTFLFSQSPVTAAGQGKPS